MDCFQELHDVLEGPALLYVELITYFLVSIPVIYHVTDGSSGSIAAPLVMKGCWGCVDGRLDSLALHPMYKTKEVKESQ